MDDVPRVDTARREYAARAGRHDAHGHLAGENGEQVDGVRHEEPGGGRQGGPGEHLGRHEIGVAEHRGCRDRLPEGPGLHGGCRTHHVRVPPILEADETARAAGFHGRCDGPRLLERGGERFLDEQVLARIRDIHRRVVVGEVGRGDDDRVRILF